MNIHEHFRQFHHHGPVYPLRRWGWSEPTEERIYVFPFLTIVPAAVSTSTKEERCASEAEASCSSVQDKSCVEEEYAKCVRRSS